MENYNDNEEFLKALKKTMKYTNITIDLQQKQYNRFLKLFGNGKECNMLLLLRILDAYVMHVHFNSFRHNPTIVQNYIFDKTFWENAVKLLCSNLSQYDIEPTRPEDDVEIIMENYDDNAEIVISNSVQNYDVYSEQIKGGYESYSLGGNYQQLPQQERLLFLRQFFDLHFYSLECKVFYNCPVIYGKNAVIFDELELLSNRIWCNTIPVEIDEKIYEFINYYMSTIPKNFCVEIGYWTHNREQLFKNYLSNFNLFEIFQYKKYAKCFVRYQYQYGAGYEWDINSNCPKNVEPENDLIRQEGFREGNNGVAIMNSINEEYCLNVGFIKPKSKTKKPNKALIKAYISYFTMNNPKVLDELSLDFVNSIMCWEFSQKNTIVTGDYDKIYKWLDMFNVFSLMNTGLICFFLTQGMSYFSPIVENLIFKQQDDLNKEIKRFSLEANFSRYNHRYFLIGKNVEIKKSIKNLVNTISFPYGGEFYELDPLADIDILEIVKLLTVHGWHLLNEESTEVKVSTQKNKDIFFNNLVKTDDVRIPLNVLYQIYRRFINAGNRYTDLRKEIEKRGFEYKTSDIRDQDKDYLGQLSKQCKKFFFDNLEIRNTEKQKAFCCKLDEKFWKEIHPDIIKNNALKQTEDFDLYLQALTEKYKPFYDVDIPEQPCPEDPYKNFVPVDKIPDDALQ